MRSGGRVFQTLVWVIGMLGLTACADASDERARPAPTQTGVPSQAGPRDCMPDPSTCGYPDVETVGVKPGTSLAPMSGVVTVSQPGQVLENRVITGSLIVTATNVTIRNVKLVSTDPYYAVAVKPGDDFDRSDAGLVLENVEIDLNGQPDVKGVAFSGFTLRNVFIHNGADCVHFSRNIRIEDSLCAVGPDGNGDGVPDGGPDSAFCKGPDHFDGFQYSGGGDVVINHNTVRNPCSQTSAMLITNDPGFNGPIRNVAITNNLMAGGGYTLYCADADDSVESEVVTGNRFARTYFQSGGRYGPTAYCEHATTFAGNVWDGTEAPIPGSAPGSGGGGTGGGGAGSPGTGPSATTYALKRQRARRVTRAALARALGRRYTRHVKKVRMRCGRRARDTFVCKVKWAGRNRRGVRHRYTGSVRVRRVAPRSWRYTLRIRDWSARCRCSSTIKRARTV